MRSTLLPTVDDASAITILTGSIDQYSTTKLPPLYDTDNTVDSMQDTSGPSFES
jgi:hypothetical protein